MGSVHTWKAPAGAEGVYGLLITAFFQPFGMLGRIFEGEAIFGGPLPLVALEKLPPDSVRSSTLRSREVLVDRVEVTGGGGDGESSQKMSVLLGKTRRELRGVLMEIGAGEQRLLLDLRLGQAKINERLPASRFQAVLPAGAKVIRQAE